MKSDFIGLKMEIYYANEPLESKFILIFFWFMHKKLDFFYKLVPKICVWSNFPKSGFEHLRGCTFKKYSSLT